MRVTASKYRSARGNTTCFVLFAVLIGSLFFTACDDEKSTLLPDKEFEELYAEVLFAGEFYRGDSALVRYHLDSLLQAHDTDTTTFFATAESYAHDKLKMETLYRETIERFESLSGANDSTRDEHGPDSNY